MMALVKIHAWHVFGRGTVRFIVALCLVVFVALTRLTRHYLPRVERVLFHADFVFDYAVESVMLMKVCALSLMTYVAMKLFVLTPYDIALVQRTKRVKVITSKCVLLLMTGVVFVALWWVWAQAIGLIAQGAVHPTLGFAALGALVMMVVVYAALFMLVGVWFRHLLALLLVWVAFWVVELSVDFGVPRTALSWSSQALNAFVANAHVFNVDEVGTVWPWRTHGFIAFTYVFMASVIYQRQAF